MNWMTPIRLARALPYKERRAPYAYRLRGVLRGVVWDILSELPLQVDVPRQVSPDLKLLLSNRDVALAPSLFRTGSFEESELRFIRSYLQPGMIAMDIGANIGLHTVVIARAIGPHGRVHAFEPSAVFDRLKRNVALNALQDRVIANHLAVGARGGVLKLNECRTGFEAYTSVNRPFAEGASTGKMFECEQITLDSYADKNQISQIDFMKIDVEGSEPDVLAGAVALLKNHRIGCILMEVNSICLARAGSSPASLIEEVRQVGFSVNTLNSGGELMPIPDPIRDEAFNVVCVPSA